MTKSLTYPIILLDRSVLAVRGAEARSFLQGLTTCDLEKVTHRQAAFGGLLTPQGKLLFDFFVIEHNEGFLLDVAKHCIEDFKKRLSFYKLRAKIEIEALCVEGNNAFAVAALVNEKAENGGAPAGSIVFDDPRSKILGRRVLAPKKDFTPPLCVDDAVYHERRIAACAPLGGLDFSYGDVFPMDVNMDLLHGISFDKGCYIGQEVVSRMKHRALIRRRAIRVQCEGPPPQPGMEIHANGQLIGQMGGAIGDTGLALMRMDRLAEANGAALQCGGRFLTVEASIQGLS